jgi:hypothetical protein
LVVTRIDINLLFIEKKFDINLALFIKNFDINLFFIMLLADIADKNTPDKNNINLFFIVLPPLAVRL